MHPARTRSLALLAATALALAPLAAGCEIAPSQAVCQVAMSPENLGIVVHDGKVSGLLTIACDQPPTSLHVSIRLTRDPGSGEFNRIAERDFDAPEQDGNYEVTAPCIPGRWRFSYSAVITANGETKYPNGVSDVTEVHTDDC